MSNTNITHPIPTTDLDSHISPPSDPEKQNPPPTSPQSAFHALGLLDRFLALWILLAMATGILLGNFVPRISTTLTTSHFASVSIPIAIGLLTMMYPILCAVHYESLPPAFLTRALWIQLAFSLLLNWLLAPSLMLALSWTFLPDEPGLRTGLILVGLARCIAMVLIWTDLAGGSTSYCAVLVAVNSVLQTILYAPLAVLFIHIISHESAAAASPISYATVATSVAVFLGIPLAAALLTRLTLRRLASPHWYDAVFLKHASPFSLLGLLFTIVILFAAQGHRVVHQIVSVLRVAAPLVVYFLLVFFTTLLLARRLGFGYSVSATQSLTAASNNFELAIAVAVATFGPESDEALACTVGPLIEVPVLLGLVYVVKGIGRRRGWGD